jgi:transcriptional regulator with XRE-family HTH domain
LSYDESTRNGADKLADAPELGARLRLAREAAGLTQDALAARSGVKLDTLRSIEQGRTRNPGVHTLARLVQQLQLSLDALVFGDRSPTEGSCEP